MNADHLPDKRSDRGTTVICACLHRTESEIRDAVTRLGLETFEAVADAVLAGTGCTTCRPEVEKILEEVRGREVHGSGEVHGPGEVQSPGGPGALPESVDGEQAAVSARERTSL